MTPSIPVRRYALARAGMGQARPEEAVRRLRLVRMEAIADRDRDRDNRPEGSRDAASHDERQ